MPMYLSKAKEILGDIILYQYSASRSDEGDATKIGLEAIIQVEFYRSIPNGKHHNLLKGETERRPDE